MFPARALAEIERGKRCVRLRVAARRADLIRAVAPGVEVLARADAAWAVWRRWPTLVRWGTLVLGAVLAGRWASRPNGRAALRWLPVALELGRMLLRRPAPARGTETARPKDARDFPQSAESSR